MSLRARLTLIYGGVLAVVFIGLGFGAVIVMQGRFTDQTRSTLTSAANYVFNNYTITAHGQLGSVQYHLPPQSAFAGVYLELVDASGNVLDRSDNLRPDSLRVNPTALRRAVTHRTESYHNVKLSGSQLEVYYTPMPQFPPAFRVRPVPVLLVAKSQSDIAQALDAFNAALFGGEGLIWVLVVGVTWLVASSALRPIKSMTDRAASIAATSDFSGRVVEDSRAAELQRLAVTFNRMLASLDEAYANQQRFLADASHELRTPLTVLQGNLHYLEDAVNAPTAERLDALHAARLEADRMGFLVGDLLALSHADAGHGIQREPVELDRVVVDAFRRIQTRERSNRRHSKLRLHLGQLDEAVVTGDQERLLQLVLILLDNAVKYTPDGGVVTIELAAGGSGPATVRVTDTGIGIPLEDRENIFQRFYRSKGARRMGEGSGLGLPIARWIVEAHGGTIDFGHAEGAGTCFIVTIPIAAGGTTPRDNQDAGRRAMAATRT